MLIRTFLPSGLDIYENFCSESILLTEAGAGLGKSLAYLVASIKYAKEHNTTSKDVIEKLKSMNITVNNHMSVIDDQAIDKLNIVAIGLAIFFPVISGAEP